MKSTHSCEYSFSDPELRSLAHLFRKHEEVLDSRLDTFRCFLEDYIYQIMTIEEAEVFFNEK
jgi:hypothetical protein